MKNIYFTLLILLTTACKAQIINIKDQGLYMRPSQGHYYKDIDNLLNPFEGTWLFTSGNRSLKIVLQKRVNQNNGLYTDDFLIGGYEYKVNNITLINTLSDVSLNFPFKSKYSISGNSILENSYSPPCPECNLNEKRLDLSFFETASNITGTLIVRKILVAGQEALKIKLNGSATKYYKAGTTPPPDDFIVPSGEYILLRQ